MSTVDEMLYPDNLQYLVRYHVLALQLARGSVENQYHRLQPAAVMYRLV